MKQDIPIERVCTSIFIWAEVMSKLSDEEFAQAQSHLSRTEVTPQKVLGQLRLWILKSNLLYRLIYLGEPLREQKCPVHDGRWSGCSWGQYFNPVTMEQVKGYCDCQKILTLNGHVGWDANVTGWLLPDNPPVTDPKAVSYFEHHSAAGEPDATHLGGA